MFALFGLGALFLVGMLVVGLLAAILSLVGFVIALPFRILGFVLRLFWLALALPFVLLAAVFGFGFALLPVLPLAALAAVIWWLVRERKPEKSGAHVVS